MISTRNDSGRLTFRERGRLARLRRRVKSGEVNEGWFSRQEVAFMYLVKAEISAGKLTDQCADENSIFWAETPHY